MTRTDEILARILASLTTLTEDIAEIAKRRRESDREARERVDDLREDLKNKLEQLPQEVLETVEHKIYELRRARWEAHQAGAVSGLPLPPAPPVTPQPRTDENTRPFVLQHRDGMYVHAATLWRVFKALWWVPPSLGGGWLTHYLLHIAAK